MSILAADKINLEHVHILMVDENQHALDLLVQIVSGFGVRNIMRCATVAEARQTLNSTRVDLLLIDAKGRDENGFDLIEWLRREGQEPNRYAPVLLVTGHTKVAQVHRSRDCGATFVVSKPVQPNILLERIFWAAKDKRSYVETDSYMGPDRRFKSAGPPPGEEGRRRDDLKGEVGAATEPNLTQEEINAMVKGSKASL